MGSSASPEFPAGLLAAEANARLELQRSDSKATTLLGLSTAVLAGVITLAANHLPGSASIALWGSTLPVGGAVFFLLAAIRPRFSGEAPAGSWLDAACSGPQAMLDTWRRGPRETAEDAAYDVCVIARLAADKHAHIRRASTLLMVALFDLAVAGLCVVIAS